MLKNKGPFPAVAMMSQVDANVMPPLEHSISGEITGNATDVPMGAIRSGGTLSKVWMSTSASGKDDSATLSLTSDVKINGTTCLTTQPVIAHVSGEASQQKTTNVTGDTGITQAVVNTAANTVSPGDMVTAEFTLTRTASPTTEMRHVSLVVEIQPSIN